MTSAGTSSPYTRGGEKRARVCESALQYARTARDFKRSQVSAAMPGWVSCGFAEASPGRDGRALPRGPPRGAVTRVAVWACGGGEWASARVRRLLDFPSLGRPWPVPPPRLTTTPSHVLRRRHRLILALREACARRPRRRELHQHVFLNTLYTFRCRQS